MQEAKQEFPGNTLSGGVFKLSAFTFAFLLFVSGTEGRFQSGTEFFGIDGTYFHLVGLAIVATLSYQLKYSSSMANILRKHIYDFQTCIRAS